MERRGFLAGGALVAIASFGSDFWRPALAATAGPGPYGTLGPADANGLQLPSGFTSRVIARTGTTVAGTAHTWHSAPDGGACFPAPSGGWIYVSNAEVGAGAGGVSAVRFLADGTIAAAYPILTGTSKNCAGGPTPWGAWLSCEENGTNGQVWECNPQQQGQGVRRAAMGAFNHEAVAVDPASGHLFLTEDETNGRLYRFVPNTTGDLSSGTLYAAAVSGTSVSWIPTSPATADRQATTTPFNGGEGMFAGNGSIYFTTKGDRKVWELVPATNTLTVLHDCATSPSDLNAVDNVTVHPRSGDIYVAEDGGNMELCVLGNVNGVSQVTAFCRIVGQDASEVTGPAFSPDGTRLYFSSQRGSDGTTGITYEVTGPFRTTTTSPTPTTATYPVTDDTYVRGGANATINYATATLLAINNDTNPTYNWLTYLMVDLGPASAAPVSSAVLRLNAAKSSGVAGPAEVLGVSDVTWTGPTMLWANRPTPGPVVGTFTPTSATAALSEVDVTSWVAARRAEGATKVAFLVRQGAATKSFVTINSRENSRGRPELVVTTSGTTPPPNSSPTASFTVTPTDLTAAVNAAASTDADGTIVSYAWNFGDGTTGTGVTASHAYVAAGPYTITLTVTDDKGATATTTRTVTVSAPAPNQPPTAAFVGTATGLAVAFDATGSADADGTITSYAWNFGDNTSGTGSTTSHTYPASGTYTVTLVTTDDDGATTQSTQPISVTAPPTSVLASDTFSRTATRSWGAATVGGTWSLAGTASDFAVNNGTGRITLATPGISRAATLTSVAATDIDNTVDFTLDKTTTGGGIYLATTARKTGNSEYRFRIQIKPTGASLQLQRVVNGTETVLVSQNIPDTYTPGTVIHLKLRATGNGTTTLAGKAWFGTNTEPATWNLQTTDTTATLQTPGAIGIHTYISSTATNTPIAVTTDNVNTQTPTN